VQEIPVLSNSQIMSMVALKFKWTIASGMNNIESSPKMDDELSLFVLKLVRELNSKIFPVTENTHL